MKKVIVKSCLRLLSFLGFASAVACRVEYGSPYAIFTVSGKVTDTGGTPIPGIEVSAFGFSETSDTGIDGTFTFGGEGDVFEPYVTMVFTDRDGDGNGGNFGVTEEIVPLTKTREPGKGDSRWFQGEYGATVNIVLEEKK